MANRKKTLREIRQIAEIEILKEKLSQLENEKKELLEQLKSKDIEVTQLQTFLKAQAKEIYELQAIKKLAIRAMATEE